MKVILKKDFAKLGSVGDTVNVKDGYAVNYLLPNHIAMKATNSNLKTLDEIKKHRENKLKKEIIDVEKLAKVVEGMELQIKVKAGEEDRIFGSVTSQNISEALADKGINIDKKYIELEEPIKHLGIYTINVRLINDVRAAIKVNVIKE